MTFSLRRSTHDSLILRCLTSSACPPSSHSVFDGRPLHCVAPRIDRISYDCLHYGAIWTSGRAIARPRAGCDYMTLRLFGALANTGSGLSGV